MEQKSVLIYTLNLLLSVITCIILKPHMFPRSLMHFPFGSLGSYIIFKSPVHGIIYIFLMISYQCTEMYGHFKLYNEDYSWIDIEGYLIGYTYTTCMFLYLNEHKTQMYILPDSPKDIV